MITGFVLRAIAIGGLIGIAASVTEVAFAAGRRPRRFVWLVALALATVVPAASMIESDRPDSPEAAPAPSTQHQFEGRGASGQSQTGGRVPDASGPRANPEVAAPAQWTLITPAWVQAFDRPLAALWIISSFLWGAILIASAIRVHRNRGRWREAMLDGMPVYMSHDIGPALFGLTRFGIVVPTWVAGLDPERRRLIVAHEREHARAADPVMLLAGALLALIQPLNPAVWVMFRRLRLAIEIDCDARVLAQAGDFRTYGDLLIDVGERTLTGAAPIAALSESGSQLARRIDAMSRRHTQRASLRALGAMGACVALGIAAWKLPLLVAAGAQQPRAMMGLDSVSGPASPRRAIVRVNSVGLHNAGPRPTILVWGERGPVRFATGTDSLQLLVDTVRLDRLPAMRFDVTDGYAVVALEGRGTLLLGAEVEGGTAERFTAAGPRIMFLRGGSGVANGDTVSPYVVDFGADPLVAVTDDVLWKLVRERFPAMVDGPLGAEPYVWLLIDGHDQLIGSNQGLGMLPRKSDGRLGNLRSSGVRRMLPGMAPRLRKGESWGWRRLQTTRGDTLNMIWVRQLYDASSPGPR